VSSLDIVVPVYNEGKNILEVLEALARDVRTPYTVLICYNRDDDDTLPALEKFHQEKVFLRAVRSLGVGPHEAVLTGFRTSTAAAVLVFPADDSYNTAAIDPMFRMIQEGCDIVAASRFMSGGNMQGCPWLKAMLVRTAAFTLHHIARVPTQDATNGLRMFSRRVLAEIEIESSEGFTYSIELLVKCHRLGWRIGEVPAVWLQRKHGKSRFRVFKWVPAYLKWYLYAFSTTYLLRGPETVLMASRQMPDVPFGSQR
jgi:dolichol-phosphate mannosyltransferase